jgi:ribosome-binding protein aMBF1 (putative translation factor)
MTTPKSELQMKPSKKRKLQRAGFKVGTVQEFLGLSDEEMALIELKVRLVAMLRQVRQARGMRQQDLADLIASSQSRIAKMEAGESDVSLDLIFKAFFSLGVSRQQLAKMIGSKRAA